MIEFLQNIPFGVITGSVLVLLTTVLLLAGGLGLLQLGVKVLLCSSHPKAPKYEWGNIFFSLLGKLCPLESPVEKLSGGEYRVKALASFSLFDPEGTSYLDITNGKHTWSKLCSYYKDCVTTDYSKVKEYDKPTWLPIHKVLKGVLVLLLLDTITYLLPLYFLPTISIVALVVVVYGVRKLAGFVYENTSDVTGHEERITTLEER